MVKKILAKLAILITMAVMANTKLGKILKQVLWDSHIPFTHVDISLMVIDSAGKAYRLLSRKFLYAASLVKIYIALEVFRQIDCGTLSLDDMSTISQVNITDPKDEIPNHGPFMESGDEVSVQDLLELMLTVSDNTAANTLIDLVRRESINEHVIKSFGWQGSEITRKFLPRESDRGYEKALITVTCAEHVADFFKKLMAYQLLKKETTDLFIGMLSRSQTNVMVPSGLPKGLPFARKSGWLTTKNSEGTFVKYISDACIVTVVNQSLIVYLSMFKTKDDTVEFPSASLTRKLFEFMNHSVS